VGGEAPVTPVSSLDSSPWTYPTNRAITSSSQGDSVDLELRLCVSEGTLSELDLAHVSKCALGRQQRVQLAFTKAPTDNTFPWSYYDWTSLDHITS
jgi:hypothetical protein